MIVAFHGFMGVGVDFQPLAMRLDIEVQAPDLIGHGAHHSMNAEDYKTDAQVAYWKERIPKGAILMGYSMGGRLALQLATRHPSHFSGLIIIGGTPGLKRIEERSHRMRWDSQQVQRLRREGMVQFVDYWQQLPIIATQQNIPDDIRQSMLTRRREQDPSMLALSMLHFGTGKMPSCWDDLDTLTMPTLLMVGESDVKYQRIAEQMMHCLPNARLSIVPNAGHCAHLEHLEWSATMIQSFSLSIRNNIVD